MTQSILFCRQDDISLFYCRGQANSGRLPGTVFSGASGQLDIAERHFRENRSDCPLSLIRRLFKGHQMLPVTGILGAFPKFEYCLDRKYPLESEFDTSVTRFFPSPSVSNNDR